MSNITTTLNARWNDGDFTFQNSLTNVNNLEIAGGTMSIDDSKLGTSINVTGNGNLTVATDDHSTNLSNVDIAGVLTINDTSANDNIDASKNADILNISGGNDTVNLGNGNDTVILDFSNVSTIDGQGGSNTAKLTGSVTADDSDFNGAQKVSNIDTLDLTGLTIDGADDKELIITKEMIKSWSDTDDDITLKLTSDQLENIQVTAEDTTATEGSASTHEVLIDAHTYDFGDGVTLTAEVV